MKRGKEHRVVAVLLIVSILMGGCASYSPSLVKLDPSGPGVSKGVGGDITVYVEEFANGDKCKRALDSDLASDKVLPLLVRVENNGSQPYEVKVADVALNTGGGFLKILTPEEAAGKAKRNPVGRAIGWSMIVPIIGIPIAVAASASHTSEVNRQIVRDFAAKSLADGTIMPHKEMCGFLFFEIDEGRRDLLGLRLEMKIRSAANGELTEITVPVPDAGFRTERADSR